MTELESKSRIQSLISSANSTTGKEDTDLTAAVGSLIAGFGQGGGSGWAYDMGEFVLTEDSVAPIFAHNLGQIPDFVIVWTDHFAGGVTNDYDTTTSIGKIFFRNLCGLDQRFTSTNSGDGLCINLSINAGDSTLGVLAPTSYSYAQHYSGITETTISLRRSSTAVWYRAGITYNYFVCKAWWNTYEEESA